MTTEGQVKYKVANTKTEFEQIHCLNYRTFVDEIPQHTACDSQRLVDRFHSENVYIIAKDNQTLRGMLAIRGRRPFSLDSKLADLDSYLPPGHRVCEFRLLSISDKHRGGRILQGLLEEVYTHCHEQGYTLAIISAYLKQEKLYHHIGFKPFGPVVGTQEALFQPMYLTLPAFENSSKHFLRNNNKNPKTHLNLLPGPVTVRNNVHRAFTQPAISHRSEQFQEQVKKIQAKLCSTFDSSGVQIFSGTGTLANNVIAAQLSLRQESGLIFSNGEFGERLWDHAQRFKLTASKVVKPWAHCFSDADVRCAFAEHKDIKWAWLVHCETSSGVLNDLELFSHYAKEYKIDICIDCVSSLGAVPLRLNNVCLASASSGKALGSYPGLSMVFHNRHNLTPSRKIPRYLDLGFYAQSRGIPFTASSNLFAALDVSLRGVDLDRRYNRLRKLSAWVREQLTLLGFQVLGNAKNYSPAVVTVCLPQGISSSALGNLLETQGYILSYRSEYLLERNWIQICLMGEIRKAELEPLFEKLFHIMKSQT